MVFLSYWNNPTVYGILIKGGKNLVIILAISSILLTNGFILSTKCSLYFARYHYYHYQVVLQAILVLNYLCQFKCTR